MAAEVQRKVKFIDNFCRPFC